MILIIPELAMLVVVMWTFNVESFPTTTEMNSNSGAAVQAPTPGTVLWCSPCRKRIKDGHPRNPMDLLTLHKKELRGNLNYIRIKLEKLQQLVLVSVQ